MEKESVIFCFCFCFFCCEIVGGWGEQRYGGEAHWLDLVSPLPAGLLELV